MASLWIVLVVAAVVMAASLARDVYEFWQGPRVLAVEFDGSGWASAVLEGNEIVPRLLQIDVDVYHFNQPPRSQIMGEWGEECWLTSKTKRVPEGWRERLSPRQAKEFIDLYCEALEDNRVGRPPLSNCAWVRGRNFGLFGPEWMRREGWRLGSLVCD